MKEFNDFTRRSVSALFASLILMMLLGASVFAQTTAFTYQGRFTDSTAAQPTNGTFDFQFALYSAASGGSPIASNSTTTTGVTVINGVFATQLNFGAAAFSGADRYLEIRVKKTTDSTYTTLIPRQQITSAPYAIHSLSAATSDNATALQNNLSSVGTLNAASNPVDYSQLKNVPAAIADFSGNNYIQNTTTQQPSANFNIDGTGKANIFDATTQYNIGGNRVLNIPGTNNTFLGINAGAANTTGLSNSFFGLNAGLRNVNGLGNVFLGVSSGGNNTSGSSNTFVGLDAGHENTTAGNNTFIGSSAGYKTNTGSSNIFVGQNAGYENTSGDSNTFIGNSSGSSNTTGNGNFFGGTNSGRANTSGTQNVILGRAAGFSNTEGSMNVFVGRSAGFSNITGNSNTYLGMSAGANSTGGGNVIIGYNSGFTMTTGENNIMVGVAAGLYTTNGSNNTLIGTAAGSNNYSGDTYVTFIGANADGVGTLTNATSVGANASVSRSNSLVLGNSANVGVGTSAPGAKLQVNGGDIYVGDVGQGVILRSPNGSCFRLTVGNNGALSAASVTCPQ